MANRETKKGKILFIIAAAVFVAVIGICALITESQWDIIFRKAGLSEETSDCRMSVHFIDVGQGDCTLIKLESGENILIDSGKDIKADKVKRYLKKENIGSLDICFVTHPHNDHYGGIPDILSEYPAKMVVMPSIPEKLLPDDDEYKNFIAFVKKNSDAVFVQSGKGFKAGNAVFDILAPINMNKDLNAVSLVIKVSLGNASFIITGDCNADEEKDILEKYGENVLKCSVLKLGHHGSEDATGDDWLDALSPDAAVVSVGKNNSYSLPSADTLKRLDSRGIKYYRTDICGDIVFKVNDDRIDVIY